ncbi:MFS transporter [Marinobacterium nitratireducens]|uniref:MFS transporter n=1 Tax=Marinobacterium nitratireducens TaxID=518897 RepID=A0A917ZCN0_9GAMM|nr:MFS transporter [Marinobacterium nitratireducens]GGO79309.1 MFS transporter [Marinobacterium nitratireducens]
MQNTLEMNVAIDAKQLENPPLSTTSLWRAIVFGTVAMLVFLLMPAYVGALATLGFDDSQLGNLASMDLAGITVACVLALGWIKRVDWRLAGMLAMASLVAVNLLCAGISDYQTLMGLRFIAGLAGGSGIVLAYTIIAGSSAPDRYTGLFVTIQVLAQSLGFVVAPSLMENFGVDSFYYLFAALALAALPLLKAFPKRGQDSRNASAGGESQRSSRLALMLVLLSMTLFFTGQGAIWAFGERIGMAGGLDAQAVANTLALTAFASLFGAALSAWMDVRYGRFWPILTAILVQLVALALFTGEMNAVYFATLFSIFAFSWNFGIAFQVGVVASMDHGGRFTALIPAFQGAGLAIGPSLAGIFLNGGGYFSINLVSGVALVAYLLFILPFAIHKKN